MFRIPGGGVRLLKNEGVAAGMGGGIGGKAAAFSLPLLSTKIPRRIFESLSAGRTWLSSKSMYSGMGSSLCKGMIYSSLPGASGFGRAPQGKTRACRQKNINT